MVQITLDNGTIVEAEDIKSAQKALRKAQIVARREAKQADQDGDFAYERAYASIGKLTCTCWDGNRKGELPRGWALREANTPYGIKVKTVRENVVAIHCETKHGTKDLEMCRAVCTHSIIDGAGFVEAIRLILSEGPMWVSVGICGDHIRTINMPTVVSEMLETSLLTTTEKQE
jgi:hypothetical protein